MSTKYKILLIGLLALGMWLVVPLGTAHAADCTPTEGQDWCYKLDFTQAPYGIATVPSNEQTPRGVWVYGSGWHPELGWLGNYRMQILIDNLPTADINITHFDRTFVSAGNNIEYWINDVWIDYFPDGATGQAIITDVESHTDAESIEVYLRDNASSTAVLTSISFEGTGANPFTGWNPETLYQPIAAADLETSSGYTANVASLLSTVPDARVYSPITGEVTHVGQSASGYTVTISGTNYHVVIGNLATVYPALGESVTAQCVIGTTGDQLLAVDGYSWGSIDQITYTIDDYTNTLDWTDDDDPSGSLPCGEKYKRDECLNGNPDLENYAVGWTLKRSKDSGSETASIANSDVLLWYGDQLYQDIVLTPSDTYYLTIVAGLYNEWGTQPLTSDTLRVTVGEEMINFTVTPTSPTQNVILESSSFVPDTPDSGSDVFRLMIENNNPGSAGIWISFVCLHSGDLTAEPSACYFTNPDVTDPAEWGYDAGAEWANYVPFEFGLGDYGPQILYDGVRLESDEYIYNSILLYGFTDAAVTYFVDVKARYQVGLSDTTNQTLVYITDAPSLELMYQDTDEPPNETVIDEFTIDNIILYRGYRYAFDVPANTTYEGNLYLTNTVTDPPDTVVEVTHVCLSPEGGLWPGFSDPILGIANPARCEAPSRPTTINPGEWIAYLTSSVKYIWNCEAASMLAAIKGAVMGAIAGIGMLGRYLAGLVAGLAAWLMRTLEVLGAGLAGALMGSIEASINDLLALDFLRLLYDILSLLIATAAAVVSILDSLFDFGVTLLGALVALFDMIAALWAALLGAINSTSAADIGYPVCANPDDPLIAVCWGVDAVDNVVQMLPALQIGGTLIAGAMAVYTIVWTMRQVGQFSAEL
jgi:hypothetical protein